MQIGKVAEKYNLSIETLHYWELVGAIPPVNRDASGKRDYNDEDLGWIHFAKCMRLAGVSIKNVLKSIFNYLSRGLKRNLLVKSC